MVRRRRLSAPAALAALLLGAAVSPALGAGASQAAPTSLDCPAGTVLKTGTSGERAFEGLSDAVGPDQARCLPAQHARVEPFAEMAAMQAGRNVISAGPLGRTPPGALRAAVAGQGRMQAAGTDVPGARGTFAPLGTTPLIADDPEAPNVNGLGLADQAGRVDSFAYDDVNDRLFSAPGTGGVWVSTDVGSSWRSIGDSLPFQSVGAVDWSPAGTPADGTLLVLSGEASAGGNVYTGLGSFYSTDSGRTWQQSTGIPDGLMGFEVDVDPTDPARVYAATSQGLYLSTDAGRTYANVVLPTGTVEDAEGNPVDCAGSTGYDTPCQNANWVTDVEVKEPGGVGEDTTGGQVIAAVGYRAGRRPYPTTGGPQSPQNGLYRSDNGDVGSFTYLDDIYGDGVTPEGFAPQERVGRTEMGSATGAEQDHDFLYAIVEDAVLFNQGVPLIDAVDTSGTGPNNTALNGVYVSEDYGLSWTRMADEAEISESPGTESALIGTGQAIFFAPGVQAWYNMWIEPDPTSADEDGVPTRLVFGLEEVWESRRSGSPQDGREALRFAPLDESFRVIGPYFADDTCAFLDNPLPTCVTQQTSSGLLTTHPDQQSGIWVPQDDGGVSLVVGNDGGTYVQTVAEGEDLDKEWGRGNQAGFNANTLLPYDAEVAKDGTVTFGLQDNGSGDIRPDGRVVETFGGDGFFTAVDPDNSDVYYNETTFADMRVTKDGGTEYRSITPPVSNPMFSNPFVMDPTDANHLLTAGPEVVETLKGPDTRPRDELSEGDWVEVFNLQPPDDRPALEQELDPAIPVQMSAVELAGAPAYVAFCSTCDIINKDPADGQIFESGLATNVGGDKPPAKASPDGWHFATAAGLPDRYITSVEVDLADPRTVYVTLSGYANRQWWPVGAFNDENPDVGEGHVFKSTDAGESFTDITGSLPDVPARWVELNQGQLLVGTDIGVFLSNNADGQRWAALEGLPRVPVTSIDNDPADPNRVVIATFGRGIYEYRFSARPAGLMPAAAPPAAAPPAAAPPAAAPAAAAPPRAAVRRTLPATGLQAAIGVVAVLAIGAGLLLRRRPDEG